MNPLKQLEACGQSPWLDNLTRSLLEKGELQNLIERDGLKGVTSNPSIFEKAIGETGEYADALAKFQLQGDHGVSEIYEHLAVADIVAAADVLNTVFEKMQGQDGYISLECSPYLANDTEATVEEALRLWKTVARRNLMVKVPGTPAGIPAIRRLIAHGLNINVTLLFSVATYEQVVEAYISGLEDLAEAGGDLSRVGSVASFFISRVDSAVDKRLEKLEDQEMAAKLRGKAAIASAKLAYSRSRALFYGPRWERLLARGARPQRLLWASTGTKNPAYPDTMYVDALIGRDTVNTMPPATMDAFRDHGTARADTIEDNLAGARCVMATLEECGISLAEVTEELVRDGVKQFADAFDKLLGAVAKQRRELIDRNELRLEIAPGSPELAASIEAEMEAWRKGGRIRHLWQGDASLWTTSDEAKWLGWLTILDHEMADIDRLLALSDEVKQRGFTSIVLLGMGGSSLGPEVFGQIFGHRTGWPHFHVLDSTDPAQIKSIEQSVDLHKTLFIVSSKSGDTLEPNILMDYFLDRVGAARGRDQIGEQFIAVTDPGSALEERAGKLRFAHIFHGVRSIGGRYSVLSKFGLVPAAAMGLDIRHLLESSRQMARSCGPDVPPAENSGVRLGVALGVAATQFARDKVTIVTSPRIADLGAWLEQLLAESTGKQGHGLIPLAGEPLTTPGSYGQDRFFVHLELEGREDPAQSDAIAALEHAGHPVVRIKMKDIGHVGQEFFRWEIATAVAGAILHIDPFDQPDVEASKLKTLALTDEYEKSHTLPAEVPLLQENGLSLYADANTVIDLGHYGSMVGYLRSHFARLEAGDYVALLAYVERNGANSRALTAMRTRIRDRTRAATCLGFGPRFLHSTGQIYKGGPNSGVFLQITCDEGADIAVPGHAYSFGIVMAAQAKGDLDVLLERGRRVLRIHLSDVESGLAELARILGTALD